MSSPVYTAIITKEDDWWDWLGTGNARRKCVKKRPAKN